jgi:hypothetical protein
MFFSYSTDNCNAVFQGEVGYEIGGEKYEVATKLTGIYYYGLAKREA